MNVVKCGNCGELFEVAGGDADFAHYRIGTPGWRRAEEINLCPPCRAAAQARGAASPSPEPPPEQAAESAQAPDE